MAGLTKAQRAEKAAAELQGAVEAQDDSHLIEMTKDGETMAVHPTCVAAHQSAGWRITEQ